MRVEQRELIAQIHGLREEVSRLARRSSSRAPDADATKLLQCFFAVFGYRAFTVSELLAHAEVPEDESLREAILAALGDLNGKRLGKFLKRIEGQDFGGLLVERLEVTDRREAVRQLRVCGFQTPNPQGPVHPGVPGADDGVFETH